MFPTMKSRVIVLFVAALGLLLSARPAQAQTPRQSSLSALQQQNALHQQQNAVQAALQQTNALVQFANQQTGAPIASYLQQQQNALQIALQQTTALQQISSRQNSALSQAALRQQIVLQNALQQTIAVQNALPQQGNPLRVRQLQALSQEQNNLMGLLTAQPPPSTRRSSAR